jgi:hypothetical protein
MGTSAEVDSAIQRLQLPSHVCRRLTDADARPVFERVLNSFVGGDDRRWWWEAFTGEPVSRRVNDGWRLLTQLVPDPDQPVWFIVEDDQLPSYPVYEATPTAIERVIGECVGFFEYYLVAKDMSWLLCENHHDHLVGVGSPITSRLTQFVA